MQKETLVGTQLIATAFGFPPVGERALPHAKKTTLGTSLIPDPQLFDQPWGLLRISK